MLSKGEELMTDYERLVRAESEIEELKRQIIMLNQQLADKDMNKEIEEMFYNDESEGRAGLTD